MAKKLMVVDDDQNICEVVRLYAQRDQFAVVSVYDGMEALAAFRRESPDVVVLDVMLPGRDGWKVCQAIRAESQVPILMLTAKGEIFDKVQGFELGADDYLVKPFDPLELMARVQAILRRTEGTPAGAPKRTGQTVEYEGLVVSLEQYVVQVGSQKPSFTRREVELLHYLASHPNRVFTREELLEAVWGYDFSADVRGVDVYIKRIRKKLESDGLVNVPWQISTVWGVGYKFEVTG